MEWIMIKVRVGQETFCKWGCSSLCFISGRREAAREPFSWGLFSACRPLIPLSAELLLPWSEGRVRFPSLGGGDPPALSCKRGDKGTLVSDLETFPAL